MTDFDDWLRGLAAAQKGPVDLPAATRGMAWSVPVELDGDWTGSTLAGDIRMAPDAAMAEATYSITGPVVADGVSTFTVTLASGTGADSTGSIPADTDRDGVVKLPTAFRVTPSGGTEELLFGGTFTLLGYV